MKNNMRVGLLVKVNAALEEENARLLRENERLQGWVIATGSELRRLKTALEETMAYLERVREVKKDEA